MKKLLQFKRKTGFGILLYGTTLFASLQVFSQNPYNIVMNMPQDPKTQMNFNWFTTTNTTGEQVEVSIGSGTFTPFKTVTVSGATPQNIHKVSVTGLAPNTLYSFRVGKANLWSSIGRFTTAKANKDAFTFIYTTDSQASDAGQFNTAQITTHAAFAKFPNANFWLQCGDLVESGGDPSQWDQFFGTNLPITQQDLFYKYPFAPVVGNHDGGTNFKNYFNMDVPLFDAAYGSTYSFIYGDVQFFAINSERYKDATYISNLKGWMRTEAKAHFEVKWRIVYFHKNIYAGGGWMGYSDVEIWRNAMAPIFDELSIDIAFQGHEHIYEVIGPVYNKELVESAVSNSNSVTPKHPENVTGKKNGIYNVTEGTLYFLNNRSGYLNGYPQQLNDIPNYPAYGIPNYRSLFTGMLGQNWSPTYSYVSVSTNNIVITTYEINNGNSLLLDEITVEKHCVPAVASPNSDILATSQTWNTNKTITKNVVVPYGVTLTITATAYFSTYTITVACGGKLVVSGGAIDDGNVVVQGGGKLTLSNNGKISLGSYDNFDVQLGGVFDMIYGEILLK